jgi:coenzyme F420 biosynthesis associated uncharacterized protein
MRSANGVAGGERFVDWGLAERIGVTLAQSSSPGPFSQLEVSRAGERAVGLVAEYTGLEPMEELPAPEAVDRAQWIRANLAALRAMSGDVERRLAESMRMPEPFRGLARTVAGTAAGGEVGLALGYVGRKVLGQYDVALVGPARPPRLLFVTPNLAQAHLRLGGERETFLNWIALHEATHALQFASVPWLRDHLGGMVTELLAAASVDGDLARLRDAARRVLLPPDPRRLVEELREGGLLRLLADPREARVLRRVQAAMAVVEGYSEHVMDAIGARLDAGYARLRDAMEADRDRRGRLDAIVARLLGLDMKLRQYRLGKRFSDAVAEGAGISGLNEVWRAPDALPDTGELEDPERWLARMSV